METSRSAPSAACDKILVNGPQIGMTTSGDSRPVLTEENELAALPNHPKLSGRRQLSSGFPD